jgi:hypothetical protein
MKVQRTVEVSKELSEVGDAVAGIVSDVQRALADGWQPGTDVPAIVVSAVTRLGVGLQGIGDIPTEVREDLKASILAVVLPVTDAVFQVVEG